MPPRDIPLTIINDKTEAQGKSRTTMKSGLITKEIDFNVFTLFECRSNDPKLISSPISSGNDVRMLFLRIKEDK